MSIFNIIQIILIQNMNYSPIPAFFFYLQYLDVSLKEEEKTSQNKQMYNQPSFICSFCLSAGPWEIV